MFKAVVIACSMIIPNYCITLENVQYPVIFNSYDECKVRALEMASDVGKYMKSFKPTRWRCQEVKEGRLL